MGSRSAVRLRVEQLKVREPGVVIVEMEDTTECRNEELLEQEVEEQESGREEEKNGDREDDVGLGSNEGPESRFDERQKGRKRIRDSSMARWLGRLKRKQPPSRKRAHNDPTGESVTSKFLKTAHTTSIDNLIRNEEGIQLASIEELMENTRRSEMSGVEERKGVG